MYTPTSGIQKYCPECKPLRRQQLKDAEHAREKARRQNSLTSKAENLDEMARILAEAEATNR